MAEVIEDIIERIKEGIEEKGEFELLLIGQMAIIKSRSNIADTISIAEICEEKGWTLKEGDIDSTSITISGEI